MLKQGRNDGVKPNPLLTDKKTPPRATSAYTFFAALYFVQSVGDPTSGLIAQPVRSLLRSWGESPASLAALMALLAIPWSIKPAFGLLSDFVPLLGSRRRNYLLLANGMAAVSLLVLAFVPLSPENRWLLFALLLPTTVGIALGDVIVDALMVEKGQPLGLTGRFQSIQWAAANARRLHRRDQAPVRCLCDMRCLVDLCLRRHVALRGRKTE
jgi:MFS family permease